MDRRTLLAIGLCFGILFAWQKFYMEPQEAHLRAQAQQQPTSGQTQQDEPVTQPQASPPPRPAHPSQSLTLSTSTGPAILGDGNLAITNWTLNSYHVGLSTSTPPVDLYSVTRRPGEVELAFDDPRFSYLDGIQGTLSSVPGGAAWAYEDSNIRIQRTVTASPGRPYLDVRINVEFKKSHPSYAFLSLLMQSQEKDPEARDRQLLYWSDNSVSREPTKETGKLKEVMTPVKYIGATNRYFVMALLDQSTLLPRGLFQPVAPYENRMSLVYPVAGNSISIPVRVFFGPKDLALLRSVDPKLDQTVDFGWFTLFAYPILKLLNWLDGFTRNYGIAIILLTIFLRVLTYPLTYKSMKSMKEMAKIQPQLQRVREKYKDDKEALNREMLALMRSHGYNPMSGCLPMIIQIPVFFALYRVLYSAIELYHAPFYFWIHDLSSRDPYYITPGLLCVAMFVQQKLTPNTATDPAQAKMMQFMPLMFGLFMIALPSGLTLYYLVNTLTGIVQQLILNKKLNITPGAAVPARAG